MQVPCWVWEFAVENPCDCMIVYRSWPLICPFGSPFRPCSVYCLPELHASTLRRAMHGIVMNGFIIYPLGCTASLQRLTPLQLKQITTIIPLEAWIVWWESKHWKHVKLHMAWFNMKRLFKQQCLNSSVFHFTRLAEPRISLVPAHETVISPFTRVSHSVNIVPRWVK